MIEKELISNLISNDPKKDLGPAFKEIAAYYKKNPCSKYYISKDYEKIIMPMLDPNQQFCTINYLEIYWELSKIKGASYLFDKRKSIVISNFINHLLTNQEYKSSLSPRDLQYYCILLLQEFSTREFLIMDSMEPYNFLSYLQEKNIKVDLENVLYKKLFLSVYKKPRSHETSKILLAGISSPKRLKSLSDKELLDLYEKIYFPIKTSSNLGHGLSQLRVHSRNVVASNLSNFKDIVRNEFGTRSSDIAKLHSLLLD